MALHPDIVRFFLFFLSAGIAEAKDVSPQNRSTQGYTVLEHKPPCIFLCKGRKRSDIYAYLQKEWLVSSKGCRSGSVFSGSSRPRDRSLCHDEKIVTASLNGPTNFCTSFSTPRWVNSMILWISGKNGRSTVGCSRRETSRGTSERQPKQIESFSSHSLL